MRALALPSRFPVVQIGVAVLTSACLMSVEGCCGSVAVLDFALLGWAVAQIDVAAWDPVAAPQAPLGSEQRLARWDEGWGEEVGCFGLLER
jgi:hypothetical protein